MDSSLPPAGPAPASGTGSSPGGAAALLPRPDGAIWSDRLYGIAMRPQELILCGDQVEVAVRFSPIFDDPAERTCEHFFLLVLEITAPAPEELAAAARTSGAASAAPTARPAQIELLKIGWELTIELPTMAQVGTLVGEEEQVMHLLRRMAGTVNMLAQQASVEEPLGPAMVETIFASYRRRQSGTTAL
jgi:hypothetical protein